MKAIDLETWNRRNHFKFFRRMDLPFYNVNFNLDISGLREAAKARGVGFNHLLIYLSTRALNRVENFRYRVRGEGVILHEKIHPSYAYLGPGEELFRLITLDWVDDLETLDHQARKKEADQRDLADFSLVKDRDDFVFISSLPWVSFTATDHTLGFNKDDGVPRVTWGKYFEDQGRVKLPYNIQVNHIFVDGFHVGRFVEELEDEVRKMGKE